MFICNNCSETFYEYDTYNEYHPYGDGTAAETWAVCPYCSDTDFDEAKKCKRCGEYVAELDEGLCEYCHGDIYGE